MGARSPSSKADSPLHEAAVADNTKPRTIGSGAEILCLDMATVTPDSPTDTIRSMFKDVEKRQGMGADFHSKHKYTCREKVAYMIDRGFEFAHCIVGKYVIRHVRDCWILHDHRMGRWI